MHLVWHKSHALSKAAGLLLAQLQAQLSGADGLPQDGATQEGLP